MLVLRHKYRNKVLKVYKLEGPLVTIGNGRNVHIRVFGPGVEAHHAVIERQGDQWVLMDLNVESMTHVEGRKIVEHTFKKECEIQIGEHTLEYIPFEKPRPLFSEETKERYDLPFKRDQEFQLVILKRGGSVVETKVLPVKKGITLGVREDRDFQVEVEATLEPKFSRRRGDGAIVDVVGPYEILRVPIGADEAVKKETLTIDPEMKKPLAVSVLAVILFLACFFGIPMPEQKKPENNVYTRMIFDSKILKKKRQQFVASNKQASGGAAAATSAPDQKNKTSTPASKAITSLRNSGLQSVIGKIAARASKSAALLASLGRMSSANAAAPPVGDQMGKVAALGTGQGSKGYQLASVGTGGKAGGTGAYKSGTGLGNGNTGTGEVGIDDEESVVEGGLDREVIAAVIREHLGQVRYCYERQLAGTPDLLGKVKVRFGIDASGSVFTQSIGQSTLKSAMVEECILRRIAKWKFPKPKGGTQVTVSYPFIFKSVN